MARILWMMAMAGGALMAQLAEGPGKEELIKNCKGCHEVERSVSKRQDKDGWSGTMTKMVGLGMKISEADHAIIVEYLAKNYPADAIPPLNINSATAIEMESRLGLRRSQAAAVLAHRAKAGPFKKFDDLKQVPGLDMAKLEEKKDRIVY